MFQKNVTISAFQEEKQAKDLMIYEKRTQMRSIPGSKKTMIDKLIMEEFKIYTLAGLAGICKRVEKRLAESENA